jgi:uncharacterized protein
MTLTCPKCQGPMRQYERSGLHVDQCTECRGIFLDRGELERLVDAENAWAASQAAPGPPAPPPPPPPPSHQRQYDYGHHSGYGQPYGGKRKKSFLEQLFD